MKTSQLFSLLIILLLSMSVLPIIQANTQTQPYQVVINNESKTTRIVHNSPLSQMVQQKIRPTVASSAVASPSYEENFTSQSTKPVSSGISLDAFENAQDFTVVISTDSSLTISDYLLGDAGDPWDGETIVLVREGYSNVSVITTSDGKYTFSLSYDRTELGAHFYSIYFEGGEPAYPGFPPARNARDLYTGRIIITDTVKISSVTPNIGPSISPNQAYIYTATLTYGDNTPFNPATVTWADEYNTPGSANGLQMSFTEVYKINGDPNDARIDQSTELNGYTATFASDSISSSSDSGNQTESMTIDLTVQVLNTTGKDTYLTFPTSSTTASILSITIETTLSVDFRVGDAIVLAGNESTSSFFRTAQNISINGTLTNNLVPSKTINTTFYIYLTYGTKATNLIMVNGTTDANGKFTHALNLNKTYFDNVMNDIILRVQIDPNNVKNLGLSDKTRTIHLKENLTNLSAIVLDNTSIVYKLSEDSITVSGNVTYDTTLNAPNVNIRFTIQGSSQLFNELTDANGEFNKTMPLSYVSTLLGAISVSVSVDLSQNNPYTYTKWMNPLGLTVNAGSVNISITTSLTPTITNIFGNALVNGANNKEFNVTLYNAHSAGNANVTIVFADQAGRAPAGRFIRISETFTHASGQLLSDSSTSYSFTITAGGLTTNVINLSNLLNLDQSYFAYEGAQITFTIEILDKVNGNNLANFPVSETYTVFGPDHSAPQLDMNNLYVSKNDGTPVGVTVRILPTNTAADNIRNITIYYRYSINNATKFENQTDFVGAIWLAENMTLSSGFYQFVIPFNTGDNGRWVEFYIIIYDLSGYGLHSDGTTAAAGEYASYNNDATLYQNITTLTAWTDLPRVYDEKTFRVPLGDTTPPTIAGNDINEETTFKTNIYICIDGSCQQIGAQPWELAYHSNVSLEVRNLGDISGIDTVIITYRARTFDPLNPGTVSAWSAETNITLSLIGGVYVGVFNTSIFTWNTQFDFKVTAVDNIGYTKTTDYLSVLTNDAITIEVADTTAPTTTAGIVIETENGESITGRNRPNNAPPQYEVWTNESIRITGSVTDANGTGISSVILYYWIVIPGSGILLNTSIVRDNLQGIATYAFSFGIRNDSFVGNATLTWLIIITDMSGNKLKINDIAAPVNFYLLQLKEEQDIPISKTDTTATDNAKSNSGVIIIGFILIVAALMVWYRRQTILDFIQRKQRGKLIRGSMETRLDKIKQLGLNKDYRRAVIEIWKGFQNLGSEGMHLPQKFYQTVREYIDKVERITTLDRDTLEILAFTFEKAKYSRAEVTIDDFEDSLRALEIAITTLIATGVQTQALDDDEEWEEIEE